MNRIAYYELAQALVRCRARRTVVGFDEGPHHRVDLLLEARAAERPVVPDTRLKVVDLALRRDALAEIVRGCRLAGLFR